MYSEGGRRNYDISIKIGDRRGAHTVEDDIEVIASDLMIEPRGRIESGAPLGIVGCRSGIELSDIVEVWSEAIDDCRGRVWEVRYRGTMDCLPFASLNILVDPAIANTINSFR